jgi:CRP/FNR family transcriptional regulator
MQNLARNESMLRVFCNTIPVAVVRPLREVKSAVPCSSCCLQGVCLPCSLPADQLAAFDDIITVKKRVARGAALFRCGDGFDTLYAVRSGAFKTVSTSRNGDEKITGFYLPGEVVGLDAISSARHTFNAVALEDSDVCAIPFARLESLAARMPQLQRQLFRVLSSDISRDQGLMLLLGNMTAEQRLAAFLLSLSRRHERLGYSPIRFHLRMTREDIGSYLGLTLETISRLFARFQREGLIASQQRDVELKNVEGMRELVGN